MKNKINNISIKITISLEEKVKRTLTALARKNKNTVSGFISEMVKRESIREEVFVPEKGLGSLLRPHHPVQGDNSLDYKEILGKLREEKHNK